MPILVDSNVLLDVLTDDPRWAPWSADALAEHADQNVLAINPIIYAEVSVGFVRIEDLDSADVSPLGASMGGCLSRRQVFPDVPQARWCPVVAAAGLLHRRARQRVRHEAADARRHALPDLLSEAGTHRPMRMRRSNRRGAPSCRRAGGAPAAGDTSPAPDFSRPSPRPAE
jgi:hypothetical protein